jgi:hypothetical protein
MVIISASPDVNNSNSIESSESVEEPPIRPYTGQKKEQVVREKPDPGRNPGGGQVSKEEVCKYAHTAEGTHLAEQLGVDLRSVATHILYHITNVNSLPAMASATTKQQLASRKMDPTRSRILNGFPCSRFS